jgi:importin subunit beta-1
MASVDVVVDICGAVRKHIQPFCYQIATALMYCLQDGSALRDIKPVMFSCFGDVAAFEPYLDAASILLMQLDDVSMQLDDDELEYINRLRLSQGCF